MFKSIDQIIIDENIEIDDITIHCGIPESSLNQCLNIREKFYKRFSGKSKQKELVHAGINFDDIVFDQDFISIDEVSTGIDPAIEYNENGTVQQNGVSTEETTIHFENENDNYVEEDVSNEETESPNSTQAVENTESGDIIHLDDMDETTDVIEPKPEQTPIIIISEHEKIIKAYVFGLQNKTKIVDEVYEAIDTMVTDNLGFVENMLLCYPDTIVDDMISICCDEIIDYERITNSGEESFICKFSLKSKEIKEFSCDIKYIKLFLLLITLTNMRVCLKKSSFSTEMVHSLIEFKQIFIELYYSIHTNYECFLKLLPNTLHKLGEYESFFNKEIEIIMDTIKSNKVLRTDTTIKKLMNEILMEVQEFDYKVIETEENMTIDGRNQYIIPSDYYLPTNILLMLYSFNTFLTNPRKPYIINPSDEFILWSKGWKLKNNIPK